MTGVELLEMSLQAVLDQFGKLNSWKQGDVRAPHKPLLALLALGELQRGNRLVSFTEHERKLTSLLREFGPQRDSYHPEYPFWRLQNDGVWIVDLDKDVRCRKSNKGDIPKQELRDANARGHFPEAIASALETHPEILEALAQSLLTRNFPNSVHQDIVDAVGLDLGAGLTARKPRDRSFRDRVLLAYGYRCAVCGLDLRLGELTIGLEAAHIKWHQALGPDSVDNGLALCSMHHKVFDLGAFTIDEGLRLLVSDQVHGSHRLDEVLIRHHGQPIYKTVNPADQPRPAHLDWHKREVFKGDTRHPKPVCIT